MSFDFLSKLNIPLEIFEEDDDEYDDDDDMIDADFDDDQFDKMGELLSLFLSHAKKSKQTLPDEDKVEQKPSQILTFDKQTVLEVANEIDASPGITQVVAKPGSGKTTTFPKAISASGLSTYVIVPNDIILANVCARNEDITAVSTCGNIKGCCDLVYVSAEAMIEQKIAPLDNAIIVCDEVQSKEMKPAIDLLLQWSDKNRIVAMYGHFDENAIEIPPNITQVPFNNGWSISLFPKKLVVHPDIRRVRNAALSGDFMLQNNLSANVSLFKEFEQRSAYTLHATYEQTVGLDLPFDVVYSCGRKYDPVYKFERKLTIAEEYQLLMRLGRRGGQGTFISNANFKQRIKPQLDCAVVPVKMRFRKPRRKKKDDQQLSIQQQKPVAIKQTESIQEMDNNQKVNECRTTKVSDYGPLLNNFCEEGLTQKFVSINEFIKQPFVFPEDSDLDSGANGTVEPATFRRVVSELARETEITVNEQLDKQVLTVFCAVRNTMLREAKTAYIEQRRVNEAIYQLYASVIRNFLSKIKNSNYSCCLQLLDHNKQFGGFTKTLFLLNIVE